MISFPSSVKSVPHYEQEINVSVVIVSLFNVCLVRMGKTLTNLLLVKCCSFSRKCHKKVTGFFFFSSNCVLFTIFLEMSPQRVCWNYLGPNIIFKTAQKLTSSQSCSKNALTEAIFLKNGNSGTHAIVFSFLLFFVRD